jgi:hypothetical protein
MRTKILILLSAALVLSANLHAQVTIGGLKEPKAGAILDLNSDAKGGLVLSNVALNHPTEIPAGFPGVTPENTDATKAGLKGALVYNTNANTCIGIHAWNGNYWARIASSRKNTGKPLSITSNWANAVGGDNIEFTVDIEAKTYAWYINKNGAGYEYLGVTTEPKLETAIPAGTINVKVIADNCQVLEESNEVTLKPESLSPNFGSTAGGNTVYLYGDFPYAGTGDYEQSGLVAHYDGINNIGQGDKSHDYSATSWTDLRTGFDLPRGTADGQWLSNGFQSLEETIAPVTASFPIQPSLFYIDTVPGAYPVDSAARTVEVIFRTPDAAKMFVQQLQVVRMIFMYGEPNIGKTFGICYRGYREEHWHGNGNNDICGTDNPWLFYAIAGDTHNLISCLSSTPSLEIPNTINTVTSTYQNNMADLLTNSFINNTPATILMRTGDLNTGTEHFTIGVNLPYATILSLRLYDRVLTSAEIAQNALLDQARYLDPPTVTIDGVPCTEVVVLSEHFLMCKVPASTSGTGNRDVEIKVGSNPTLTLDGAYKYVNAANDFYISNISRIIGTAGDPLTLTGNLFEHILEVKVGNVVCPKSNLTISTTGADGTDTCTFNLPANSPGETDITITMDDAEATTYRFAKIFEYR